MKGRGGPGGHSGRNDRLSRERQRERERKKEEKRDTKDSTLLDLKGGSQKPRNACDF